MAHKNNKIPATLLMIMITFDDKMVLILLAKNDLSKSVVKIMETMPNMKLIASGGLFLVVPDETMDNQSIQRNGFMIFKKKPLMISVKTPNQFIFSFISLLIGCCPVRLLNIYIP